MRIGLGTSIVQLVRFEHDTAPSDRITDVIGYAGGGSRGGSQIRTFNPYPLPPSISSGCGGIDLYLGSYSFPNKDQFVQALRNFGKLPRATSFSLP